MPALQTLKEDLHFLLTNRLPRRWATQFMGWFSTIEVGWVRDLSLAAWRACAPDLDLSEAKKSRFASLHDCFVRELKDGARTVDGDPRVVTSPCDAIVGAHGRVEGTRVFQAKGFPYALEDLLGAFVGEPARLTPAQMERWPRDFDNWAVCDTLCFHRFDRSPHAFAHVRRWAQRKEEFVRRAGVEEAGARARDEVRGFEGAGGALDREGRAAAAAREVRARRDRVDRQSVARAPRDDAPVSPGVALADFRSDPRRRRARPTPRPLFRHVRGRAPVTYSHPFR